MTVPQPGPAERRASERRTGHVEVRCRFTKRQTEPFWPAVLCNASAVGICLHTTSPIQRKDLLVVELPELPTSPKRRLLLARVVHVQRLPVLGGRIAGCSLVRCRLSQPTLQGLLGEEGGDSADGAAPPTGGGRAPSMPLPASRRKRHGRPAERPPRPVAEE